MSIENLQPTELDKQAESLISDMASEFAAQGLDGEIDAVSDGAGDVGGTPLGAAPGQTEKPVEQVAPPGAAPDAGVKPEEPGYERLVAREVALLEREKAVKSWETEKASYEEKLKTLEARAIPDDWAVQLESDPEDTLARMGVDPEQLVRSVIARRLEAQGKEVPEELRGSMKANREKLDVHRKIQALQAKIDQQEREAAARTFFDQVSTGAREYVTKGVSEKTPTVSQVAKRNPDWVHGQIMEVIAQDANRKAARDPNAKLLSYEEAAAVVEQYLTPIRSALIPENASTVQTPTPPAPGAKNGTSTTPPVAPKPGIPLVTAPEKPLAPWLQKPESDDAALKEALMEYRRVEKLGKDI